MQEKQTIARPYAEAAFKQANSEQAQDSWSEALALLQMVLEDENIKPLLDNPTLGHDDLTSLVLQVIADKLSPTQQNLVKLLGANKRFIVAGQIRDIYAELLAEQNNQVAVTATSAFALDQNAKDKLAKYLENELQRKVDIEVVVDSELIGGVIVKAGDMVIDSSIRGNIEKMAAQVSI